MPNSAPSRIPTSTSGGTSATSSPFSYSLSNRSSMADKVSRTKTKATVQHTNAVHAQKGHERNRRGWSSELDLKVIVFDRDVEDYVEMFVPSDESIPECPQPTGGVFNMSKSTARSATEKKLYGPLKRGLEKLVSRFPERRKLAFAINSDNPIKFPFRQHDHEHHHTRPDIIASLPGDTKETLAGPRWRHISIVLEVKPRKEDDPVGKGGRKHEETLVQLAKSARNILVAQGRLFVYVVGVYGEIARIYRFDRAGAVISRTFNYEARPEIFHKFLWRFVHPMSEQCNVVGADPSIQAPILEDILWAQKLVVDQLHSKFDEENRKICRWVTIEDASGRKARFLVFRLLFINPRLFSRATIVWEAFKEGDDSGKTFIVKDSWRQLARDPETQYYDDIMSFRGEIHDIATENVFLRGIAEFEIGVDLGTLEAREVETNLTASPVWSMSGVSQSSTPTVITTETSTQALLSTLSDSTSEDDNDFVPRDDAFLSDGSSVIEEDWDPWDPMSKRLDPPPAFKIGHITIAALYCNEEAALYNNRSHTRLALRTVGRPLSQFKRTKEMVEAIRDAIAGHQLAFEAGVLHRDVSDGNVMIANGAPFKGFIGDFDYSFNWKRFMKARNWLTTVASWQRYVSTGQGIPDTECEASILVDETTEETKKTEHKERTGTLMFMAIDVLSSDGDITHEARHDIESFYWLLIWIVLRYTRHNHKEKDRACGLLFDPEYESQCFAIKKTWLSTRNVVSVPGNPPLTALLEAFRKLCKHNNYFDEDRDDKPIPVTYEDVLATFDEVLARDDWPENDAATPFALPADIVDKPARSLSRAQSGSRLRTGQIVGTSRHGSMRRSLPNSKTNRSIVELARGRTTEPVLTRRGDGGASGPRTRSHSIQQYKQAALSTGLQSSRSITRRGSSSTKKPSSTVKSPASATIFTRSMSQKAGLGKMLPPPEPASARERGGRKSQPTYDVIDARRTSATSPAKRRVSDALPPRDADRVARSTEQPLGQISHPASPKEMLFASRQTASTKKRTRAEKDEPEGSPKKKQKGDRTAGAHPATAVAPPSRTSVTVPPTRMPITRASARRVPESSSKKLSTPRRRRIVGGSPS